MKVLLSCFAILAVWTVLSGGESRELAENKSVYRELNRMKLTERRTKRSDRKKEKNTKSKDTESKLKNKTDKTQIQTKKNSLKKKSSKRKGKGRGGNQKGKKKIKRNKTKRNIIKKGKINIQKSRKNVRSKKKGGNGKKRDKRVKKKSKTNKNRRDHVQNKNKNMGNTKSKTRNKNKNVENISKRNKNKNKYKNQRKTKILMKQKTKKEMNKYDRRKRKQIKRFKSKVSKNSKKKDLCEQIDAKCEDNWSKGSRLLLKAIYFIIKIKRVNFGLKIVEKKNNKSSNDNIFGIAARKKEDIVIYPNRPRCTKNTTTEVQKENITNNYGNLKKCNELVVNSCNSIKMKRNTLNLSECNQTLTLFRDAMQNCNKRTLNTTEQCNCLNKIDFTLVSNKCNFTLILELEKQIKKSKTECLDVFQSCKKYEDASADLLEACVGGKPDNTNPNTVSIGQIQTSTKTKRDDSVIGIEMDVFENTQSFTQKTTYYKKEGYVEIQVPKHGHFPNDIVESTVYFLSKDGPDSLNFDRKIVKTEKGAYCSNISIVKKEFLDPIEKVVRSQRKGEIGIDLDKMEYKSKSEIYIPTKVEKRTLLPLEQRLVGDTEDVFMVHKFEVSKEELTTYKRVANLNPNVPFNLYKVQGDDDNTTLVGYGFAPRNNQRRISSFGRNRHDETRKLDCPWNEIKPVIFGTTQENCEYTISIDQNSAFTISFHTRNLIFLSDTGSFLCCNNMNLNPGPYAKCYCQNVGECLFD